MTENIQLTVSEGKSPLTYLGRDLCAALISGNLDECLKMIVQHAEEIGYEFDAETWAMLKEKRAANSL